MTKIKYLTNKTLKVAAATMILATSVAGCSKGKDDEELSPTSTPEPTSDSSNKEDVKPEETTTPEDENKETVSDDKTNEKEDTVNNSS